MQPTTLIVEVAPTSSVYSDRYAEENTDTKDHKGQLEPRWFKSKPRNSCESSKRNEHYDVLKF